MSLSQIKITFNEDIPENGSISIDNNISNPPIVGYQYEVFKNIRTQPNECIVGVPTSIIGEISAYNFTQAFMLDYNSNNDFQVTQTLNEVLIKAFNPLFSFTLGEAFIDNLGNPADVIFDIQNSTGVNFNFSSINFSTADNDYCSKIKVNVATTEEMSFILSPFFQNINPDSSVFSFDWNRNQTINIKVRNAILDVLSSTIQLPSFLNIATRNVVIDPTQSGTNVTIYLNVFALTLEYSLDNVTWQSSNSFSGLLSGNYTVYVRDQYGCVQNFPLVISANDIYNPFFKISKSNSIRFANRITFGDAANYRNDENTLSCEVNVPVPYKEVQLFQTADVITTQFKSNYTFNVAKVIKEDSTFIDVPVIKKSNNIGLKDSRDAILFNLGFGKTGIYFIAGNTYNYNTNAVTGTYTLNGTVPNWAVPGNYIRIGVQFYLIEDVIFNDEKNSDVIVITYDYAGSEPEQNAIVSCRYNAFNYEIYEFTIDMVNYINENIRVKIEGTDANFVAVTLLSEQINVAVRQENTIDINYWNEENTDIFYQTGIRNRIRIPFTKQGAADEDESDSYKTDTNTVLLSAEIHEVEEFIFEPMTKELHRKLKQALSHKYVVMDGIYYVKNRNFDVEGPLEDSNLYVLKAKMIKAGSPFNNQTTAGFDLDNGLNEIPGLMQTDTGFLKYQ